MYQMLSTEESASFNLEAGFIQHLVGQDTNTEALGTIQDSTSHNGGKKIGIVTKFCSLFPRALPFSGEIWTARNSDETDG